MALNYELLNILACPQCHGPITLVNKEQGLLCPNCKCVYPIYDDIPILLIEKAIPEDDWNKKVL